MVKNYNNFILENKLVELILEGTMYASVEFLLKISKIKDKNAVASVLFDIFEDEIFVEGDMPQNYINITDKNDKITFISDKKADKLIDNDIPFDDLFTTGGRTEMVGSVESNIKDIIKNKDKELSELAKSWWDSKKEISKKKEERVRYMLLFESFKNIEDICKMYKITNYTINPDETVDVDGNVNLISENLSKLSRFKQALDEIGEELPESSIKGYKYI